MALASEDIADLGSYKDILQYLIPVLDKESTICSDVRKLTDDNIALINTTIENALTGINAIILPPV